MGQDKSLSDIAPHLGGSGAAAIINFPLWKAAAIGQSGFREAAGTWMGRMKVVFGPPYKGVAATIFGMTWARAAIFYGADHGKELLLQRGAGMASATTLPPVIVGISVQLANQPIVRSTIMLQDPTSTQPNVLSQLVALWRQRGWQGLWHGSTVSVFKTVPKYASAIWVKVRRTCARRRRTRELENGFFAPRAPPLHPRRAASSSPGTAHRRTEAVRLRAQDIVQARLPPPTAPEGTPGHRTQVLCRSAAKSVAAGVAGAALTNPLDVVRNEMFKVRGNTNATHATPQHAYEPPSALPSCGAALASRTPLPPRRTRGARL